MAFGIGESLSVRISADTGEFIADMEMSENALDEFSSEAIQTAAALEILSNRADDAGDNVSQAGTRASVASGQFSMLSSATSAANASFLGISATTWGSLIPAVIALGAALAPVIGALGGFVAVAGAIGGIGIVGTIGAIATNSEQLQTALSGVADVIRSEFGEMFDYMTAIFIHFTNTLEDVIPLLVPTREEMQEIGTAFVNLGDAVINMLPAFTDLAVALAQEFLPPFTRWMQDILPQVPGMIRGFVDVFDRMLPKFMEAGRLMAELLPPFTEFGFTVLEVLGPALATVAEEGTAVLEWINGLSEGMQRLIAASALLSVVATVFGKLFGAEVITAAASLAGSLSGIAGAANAAAGSLLTLSGALTGGGALLAALVAGIGLFVMFEDEIRAVVNEIEPIVASAFNSLNAWLQSAGASLLRQGMRALGRVIRLGAIEIYNILAKPGESVIRQAVDDVAGWLVENGPGILNTAWDTLVSLSVAAWEGFRTGLFGEGSSGIIPRTFNRVASWLVSTATGMLATAAEITAAAFLTPFQLMFNSLQNIAVEAFNDVIGTVNDVVGVLPSELTTELGIGGGLAELDAPRRPTDPGRAFQQARQNIQVVIEGELPEESIKSVSAETYDVRERQDTSTLRANETPSP